MIIGVLNQKGGVGKSTLSVHIAAAFARMGKRVLMVDADPQASTMDCSASREEEGLFPVIGLPKASLHRELKPIASNFNIVVIDGPPRACDVARYASLWPSDPPMWSIFHRRALCELFGLSGAPDAHIPLLKRTRPQRPSVLLDGDRLLPRGIEKQAEAILGFPADNVFIVNPNEPFGLFWLLQGYMQGLNRRAAPRSLSPKGKTATRAMLRSPAIIAEIAAKQEIELEISGGMGSKGAAMHQLRAGSLTTPTRSLGN